MCCDCVTFRLESNCIDADLFSHSLSPRYRVVPAVPAIVRECTRVAVLRILRAIETPSPRLQGGCRQAIVVRVAVCLIAIRAPNI